MNLYGSPERNLDGIPGGNTEGSLEDITKVLPEGIPEKSWKEFLEE